MTKRVVLGVNVQLHLDGTFSAVGPLTVTSGCFCGAVDMNNDGSPSPGIMIGGSQDAGDGA